MGGAARGLIVLTAWGVLSFWCEPAWAQAGLPGAGGAGQASVALGWLLWLGPALWLTALGPDASEPDFKGLVFDDTEGLLTGLTACLAGFTSDPLSNIDRLTAAAGELTGADCAMYNRLADGELHAWGAWNAPPHHEPTGPAQGRICHDVIQEGSQEVRVVRELQASAYAATDPCVGSMGLQTYMGRAVMVAGRPVGALCAAFKRDTRPKREERRLLDFLAAAIGAEERRLASRRRIMDESRQRREELEHSQVLLREVHHRVKNNMQVLTSLLNLQANAVGPGPAADALTESLERVQAMGLVHELLHQSSDLGQVGLDEYCRRLGESLFKAHGPRAQGVRLVVDAGGLALDVKQAPPVGLALNELITNALRHAFDGQGGGQISIIARQSAGGGLSVVVRDDGVGLSNNSTKRPGSLGLTLVRGLVESQLSGSFEADSPGGARFRMEIPPPRPAQRNREP